MDTEQLILAVAAYGCRTTLELPTNPLEEDSFGRLLRRVENQRLTGMLAFAVGSGDFPVTDGQLDRLCESEQFWAVHALQVERLLLDIAELFDDAEVPFRVFKGPALARTAYPEPRMRVFGDLDLIVPSARFDHARLVLQDRLGAEQRIPELRPGFDREFGKEALLKVDGRYEIDLHRTLASGPIGLTIPLDELFAQQSTFELASRDLPTLTPVQAFVQTCINAAIGDFPPRACSLRDVAQVVPTVADRPDEALATAKRWGAGLAVQRAVELAWTELRLDARPVAIIGTSYRASVVERLGMRSYLTPSRSYTRPAASLLAIRGLRPRLRYLRAIVSPQQSYLKSRRWDRRGHAQRAVKRLRRR